PVQSTPGRSPAARTQSPPRKRICGLRGLVSSTLCVFPLLVEVLLERFGCAWAEVAVDHHGLGVAASAVQALVVQERLQRFAGHWAAVAVNEAFVLAEFA